MLLALLLMLSGPGRAEAMRIPTFLSRCAGFLARKGPAAPDHTVLDLTELPPAEREIYAHVRAQRPGALGGWEDSRSLRQVYSEVGVFNAALMSSLERLLYGDGLYQGRPATRWLDVGSGTNQAARDFQRSVEATHWRLGHDIEVVGVEPNYTGRATGGVFEGGPINVRGGGIARGAESRPNERIHLKTIAKFFEEVADHELGTFALITSTRAAPYYSPRVTHVINKMLRLRAVTNRTIFDVRKADVVITKDRGEVPLHEWLEAQLKLVVDNVDTSDSYVHEGVRVFLVSDLDLVGPSGQLPELTFRGLDSKDQYRIFAE